MSKENFVAISHFINPQLFWYHTVDGRQNPAFVKVQKLEESIQSLFTSNKTTSLRPHRPQVGEIVAVAFVSWNKYIRARVENIAKYAKSGDEYVVWSLDYGFPFQTKLCYIRKLPESYAERTDYIRLGGIADSVPAELDFDFVTTTTQTVCKKSWSTRAVEMLEKVIYDAASISFIESFCMDRGSEQQHFGELKIINHSGDEFLVSDYLIKLNFSVKCDNGFLEKLATLKTIEIPCWQTNSKDVRLIENKLNTFNVNYAHQGKFELSGSVSEESCDTFSKQKVMDWCRRNQSIDSKDLSETYAPFPTSALDASDIRFEDSVSVQNCKPVEWNEVYDETVMGCAGALHKSRKLKYEGKQLPPLPSEQLFEVIPQAIGSQTEKNPPTNSGDSVASGPSQRAKMLIDLRKKHQEHILQREDEDIPQQAMKNLSIVSLSEGETDEFLQSCKQKNAHSTRLEKLKEMRKRHKEKENNSKNELMEDDTSTSTTSVRSQFLKKLREKHAKRSAKEVENFDAANDVASLHSNSDIQSHTDTHISAHAAKLISMRKKIKEKYNQESSPESNSSYKETNVESMHSAQSQNHGYKMPHLNEKFPKFESLDEEKNKNSSRPKAASPADQLEPELNSENESIPISTTGENELRKLREVIHTNPYKSNSIIPAGFDLEKLVERKNKRCHWSTKKTTVNEPLHSNYSYEVSHNSSGSNYSNRKPLVSRRTEDVEQTDFRLTGSRKERKKNTNADEKYILDLSLNDTGCAPALKPVIVNYKHPKLLYNLSEEKEERSSTGEDTITNICSTELDKTEKLVDLSTSSEVLDKSNASMSVSSDSFVKFIQEKISVPDTSREHLLNCSSVTSVVSLNSSPIKIFDEENKENIKSEANYKESSSSISSCSFTKLEMSNGEQKKAFKDQDHSYEACSSSGSSARVAVMHSSQQDNIAYSNVKSLPKESNSSVQTRSSSPQPDDSPKLMIDSNSKHYSSSSSPSSLFRPPALNEIQSPERITQPLSTTPEKARRKIIETMSSQSSSTSSSLVNTKLHTSETKLKEAIINTKFSPSNSVPHLLEVAGETSLKTNFIQHLVLAHSNVPVSPIERMSSALFSAEIHREMENMRLTKLYRIQSFAWAHLVRGNSFFVINTSRTGKTWCYLPPLCSMVSYRLETKCVPQTYGPVAIIIAPSSIQVESIARNCNRLLASTKTKVTVVPSYAFRNTSEVKIELHNGCGILVITPPGLQRLLVANEREALLNIERIQYVVVDGLDTMMDQNADFDDILHRFLKTTMQHQKGENVAFQMVVTSKRWSRRFIHLIRMSNQPLLCIADYLEAAVYAKARISIKLQKSNEKMAMLIKCLEKCPHSIERVLVVCNSHDEVDEVEKSLLDAGHVCLAYSDRMPVEMSDLVTEWKVKMTNHQILVTVDSVLPELMIQNVWTVIHYSLPLSWTKFNFRFSVFLKNYENLITINFEKPEKVPRSLILLDENNNLQLPRLIEFMKHHNQVQHIHPDILNVAAKITAEREEARVVQGIPMCPKILEFGSCDQSNRCPNRHQLTKYDGPIEGIPRHGEVRLKILDVISPTHYIARLLTHKKEESWEIVKRSDEVTYFLMQLTLHFMNEEAQVIHWPVRVKDLCVYKGEGIFHRCRVLEAPPIVHDNIVKLVNVKVKLIDSGSIFMCKSHDLFVMPDKFKDFPAQAVDIRLSGVVPYDNERVWDSRSTRAVKNWIMTDITENDCLQAGINFALMDTIWVNSVILMEKLATIRGYAIKINVRRSLLNKEFALADDTMHLVKQTAMENSILMDASGDNKETGEVLEQTDPEQNLLQFSTSISSVDKDASYSDMLQQSVLNSTQKSKPNSAKKVSRVSKKPTEDWTKFALDELLEVEIAQFKDPDKFFLCLKNKEEDFNDLEDIILSQKLFPLEDPQPMENCLAPRDGKYYRAKIQRLIVDVVEGRVQARVFFCDIGIFSIFPLDHLRASTDTIVEHIPFQAICCKLTGLRVETVGEEIQNVLNADGVIFAYAVKETLNSNDCDEEFHTRKYEVILYECFSGKNDIQINKLLVEHGLASYDDDTKHFLELECQVDFEDFSYEHGEANNFQDFLERMMKIMADEDAEKDLHCSSNEMASDNKFEEIFEESTSPEVKNIASTKADFSLPVLRALHKRPQTNWYETMCMIYLVIHAPDISDYHLEVNSKRVIFVANIDGEPHVLILHLLGYIEPDKVTHEIRGLNVVVRLVKSLFMEWPRLLESDAKFPWLTYNFNAIDAMDAEKLIDDRFSKPNRAKGTNYSSEDCDSETSESNPCETFTPIVNMDDVHDPMQDVF